MTFFASMAVAIALAGQMYQVSYVPWHQQRIDNRHIRLLANRKTIYRSQQAAMETAVGL